MAPLHRDQKVFGIGLSKTGTTSLNEALNLLGIKSIHFPHDEQTSAELQRGHYRLSILSEYQGITDTPVAPFFAQLDRAWPGSKFVLTVRDLDSWLRSAEAHWRGIETGRRLKDPQFKEFVDFLSASVYGCIYFNPERFAYAYETHVKLVRDYFAGRTDDFLELNIFRGDGLEQLSRFLGVAVPYGAAFPHINRADDWERMIAEAKQLMSEVVPPGETVIVIDEEQLGDRLTTGRVRLPFLERSGEYWGLPPSDDMAISELERLRAEQRATFLAVAEPGFWWLEHYVDFATYLHERYRIVLRDPKLMIWSLDE